MRKHYHRLPGIQQKAERSHSIPPMHHDIHLSKSKGTDETTHISETTMSVPARTHASTCKTCARKRALKLIIDLHSWLFHFSNAKEDICSMLISGSDILDYFGHTPDERGRQAQPVSGYTLRSWGAFPQHCTVGCDGDATVLHGNRLSEWHLLSLMARNLQSESDLNEKHARKEWEKKNEDAAGEAGLNGTVRRTR